MAFRSPVWLLPPFQSSALPVSRGGNRLPAWRRILPRVFRTPDSWKKLPRGLVPSNACIPPFTPEARRLDPANHLAERGAIVGCDRWLPIVSFVIDASACAGLSRDHRIRPDEVSREANTIEFRTRGCCETSSPGAPLSRR